MSGGIAQLVAVGAQDAHLVGDPEVSFFRSTYRRHTNFSQTVERQVIQGALSEVVCPPFASNVRVISSGNVFTSIKTPPTPVRPLTGRT